MASVVVCHNTCYCHDCCAKKRSFPEITRRGKRSCGRNWVTDLKLERSVGWRHVKVWMLQVKGRCLCISNWGMSYTLPIKRAPISDNPFFKVWHHVALSICTLLLLCCLTLKQISGYLHKMPQLMHMLAFFQWETLNVNIQSWLGQLEILLFYIVNSASKVISFAITKKDADKLHNNISGIFKLKARIPGMVQIIRELEQQSSSRRGEKKERGNSELSIPYLHYMFYCLSKDCCLKTKKRNY